MSGCLLRHHELRLLLDNYHPTPLHETAWALPFIPDLLSKIFEWYKRPAENVEDSSEPLPPTHLGIALLVAVVSSVHSHYPDMSSPPAIITVPAPAYDEAEKGALPDVHTRPLEVSFNDEKKQDLTVAAKVVPVPSEKKPAAPPAKKPPPPPTLLGRLRSMMYHVCYGGMTSGNPAKRKTPNRILWILWYDMYRWVLPLLSCSTSTCSNK